MPVLIPYNLASTLGARMAPYDGVGGHYHWLATQKMVGLLLDTGEARVEIDVHDGGMGWVEVHTSYDRIAVFPYNRKRINGFTDLRIYDLVR